VQRAARAATKRRNARATAFWPKCGFAAKQLSLGNAADDPRKSWPPGAAHRDGEVAGGSALSSPVNRLRGRHRTPRSSGLPGRPPRPPLRGIIRSHAKEGREGGVCDPQVFCASKLPNFLARWRVRGRPAVRGPAGTGSVGDGVGEGAADASLVCTRPNVPQTPLLPWASSRPCRVPCSTGFLYSTQHVNLHQLLRPFGARWLAPQGAGPRCLENKHSTHTPCARSLCGPQALSLRPPSAGFRACSGCRFPTLI